MRWVDTDEHYMTRDYLNGGKEPKKEEEEYINSKPQSLAGKDVPKVTAGTKLYITPFKKFYKQTATGQWYAQGGGYSGKWYKLPKGWKPHSGFLKVYKAPSPAKKATPAKKTPTELGLKNQLESGLITSDQYKIGSKKAKKVTPAKKTAAAKMGVGSTPENLKSLLKYGEITLAQYQIGMAHYKSLTSA